MHFEPLTSSDISELNGPRWSDAIYCEAWKGFVGDPNTLKLVRDNGLSKDFEGIVRLGKVITRRVGIEYNLLESASANRYTPGRQSHLRGVGRVLIARLLAESYRLSGGGAMIVKSHERAIGFYRSLGFMPISGSRRSYYLTIANAEAVFALATL